MCVSLATLEQEERTKGRKREEEDLRDEGNNGNYYNEDHYSIIIGKDKYTFSDNGEYNDIYLPKFIRRISANYKYLKNIIGGLENV